MRTIWQRALALVLSAAMIFSMNGVPVYAADLEQEEPAVCPHHVHDESCGYSEGTPCTHEHTEGCYALVTRCVHEHTAECYSDGQLPAEGEEKEADACAHVCSEESGCITKELNCQHVHDESCGYSEGTPCTFDAADCELCNPPQSGETAGEAAPETQDEQAGEAASETQARRWQFDENPNGFLIADEGGIFYADAPGGNIPLEAVAAMLPQSLTVDADAGEEPVTVAVTGWECAEYQYAGGSWPQNGSYTFTAQVATDIQLDPAPAVTLRLINMVQTLATVNDPTLDLANGSIWIRDGQYYQGKTYAAGTTATYINYTGTITITGSNKNGYSCVRISNAGSCDIVLDNATLEPLYASSAPIDSASYGLNITGSAVNLTLKGTSSVKGTRMQDEYAAYDGIHVAEGSTLTIQGDGTLNVYGGDSSRVLANTASGGNSLCVDGGSYVTIEGDAKVNLYGGNYFTYDQKYMQTIGGCTVMGDSTLCLQGNSQVNFYGFIGVSGRKGNVVINSGRHTISAFSTAVSPGTDPRDPYCTVNGGSVEFHLVGNNGDSETVYTPFDWGIYVENGEVVFSSEISTSSTTAKIKFGSGACFLEGNSESSASFTKKATDASQQTVNKKYVRVFFDKGDTTYTLTVNGTGSGGSVTGSYAPGTEVTLNAGTKDGYALRRWNLTAGTGLLRDASSAQTGFVLYDSDATVTAEFGKVYGLTVQGGSITSPADQDHFLSGTQVSLQAEDHTDERLVLDNWTVESDSGTFENAESTATTFTTGETDTTIKANFVTGYDLTVVNGTGSGLYKEGAQVAIQAEIQEGIEFSHWEVTGSASVADANAVSTTVTMSGENATVTAVYQEDGVYGDFVVTGTDDGFSFSGDILDFTGSGVYTVRLKSGVSETKDRIRIRSGSPTIIITDLTLTNNLPFEIQNGDVTLKLDGSNTFRTSHQTYAALQKGTSGTLTITSAQGDGSTYGSLTITSGDFGAGIGGAGSKSSTANGGDTSNITINGGTLNITTKAGAGIGGGGSGAANYRKGGNGSKITINGGDITIRATKFGAGIGGGGSTQAAYASGGNGSNITITGGKLSINNGGSSSSPPGSAIGGGHYAVGSQVNRGSGTNIYVLNNPTVFKAAAWDDGTYDDYLGDLGADGRVDGCVPYFNNCGVAKIEYGSAAITAVEVQPNDAVVVPGASQYFTAVATGTGSWTAEWTVSGNNDAATTITPGGLLTVGANETAASLTVTATIQGTQISGSVAVGTVQTEVQLETPPTANDTITYGQTLADIALTGGSVTTKDGQTVAGTFQWADSTLVPQAGTGVYDVVFVPSHSRYKTLENIQVSVTVSKATPTIAWTQASQEMEYTGSEAAVTPPLVTLVNNETYDGAISYRYKAEGDEDFTNGLPVNAGSYTVVASIAAQSNYNEADTGSEMTLTIRKAKAAVATDPAAIEDLVYNGISQLLVRGGAASGGELMFSLEQNGVYSLDTPEGRNAGAYTVYYKAEGDQNHEDSDVKTLTVEIARLPVVLSWDYTAPYIYDSTTKCPAAAVSNKADEADEVNVTVIGGQTEASDTPYTATATALTGAASGNYTLDNGQNITLEFVIDRAASAVTTAPAAVEDLIYNGLPQQLVTAGVAEGGSMQYSLNGKDYTDAIPTGIDAGEYTVYYYVKGDANHNDSAPAEVKNNIGKADISGATVSLSVSNFTYTGAEQKPAVTVTLNDSPLNESADYNVHCSGDTTNVGEVTVIVTGTGNYTGTAAQQPTYIIGPAAPTLTWSEPSQTVTYTGSEAVITPPVVTLVNSETYDGAISYRYKAEGDEDFTNGLPVNAGSYTVVASIAAQGNYTAAVSDELAMTIDKATVGSTAPAAVADLIYNGLPQQLVTAGEADGGEMQYSLDGKEYTGAIPTGIDAGEYTVYYYVKGDANHDDSAPASLTVNIAQKAAVVSLQPGSSNRIHVGDELPAVSLVFTGLVKGDSIEPGTVVLDNMPADSTAAGEYALAVSAATRAEIESLGKNYSFTYTGATLTILEKAVVELPEPEVPDAGADEAYRLEQSDLTKVPAELEGIFSDVEEIREAMFQMAVTEMPDLTAENTLLYDVTLYYSTDGGRSWIKATQDDFPATGIEVVLPYPAGTNAYDYDFVVTHMFTSGALAGQVESPAVTKAGNGLRFTVYGLSPVAVSWKMLPKPDGTDYYTCPACGHHDWTATDQGYRCDTCGYLETLKQLVGYGNVQGVYEPKTGSTAAIPQTGDGRNLVLWCGLLALGGTALTVTLGRRKRRQ